MQWDFEAPISWEHPVLQPAAATVNRPSQRLAHEWSNALLYTLPLQQMGRSDERAEDDERTVSWLNLALSVIHQAVRDAAGGDPDALAWLLSEGKSWLEELDVSPLIVDAWAADL